jgi:hypothetical protein
VPLTHTLLRVRLHDRLEIRALAATHGADLGEVARLEILADVHGEDAVLAWLRNGLPTPRLDVPVLGDLLAAGVTEDGFRWLISG